MTDQNQLRHKFNLLTRRRHYVRNQSRGGAWNNKSNILLSSHT